MRPVLMWFRRDLRTFDNAALVHAAATGAPVVPFFIFDTEIIDSLPSDGAVFDFQADCLRDLKDEISALGGTMIVRSGKALEVHRQLIDEFEPSAIFFNRDYEPSALERDAAVERLYRSQGIDVVTFKDTVVHEPSEVLTGEGKPYVVFTPFGNAWKKLDHPVPFGKPQRFTTPRVASGRILGARELTKTTTVTSPAFAGGSKAAGKAWSAFLRGKINGYATGRDLPATSGTSGMSAYLRFGCISVRQMLDDCVGAYRATSGNAREAVVKYVDELIWREFYQAVLFHFPRLVTENYRKEFDALPWSRSEKTFAAWCEGRTGFPLVDAGMRELNTTGWMHNRVRMVVASFLTKDLLIDWRRGEKYFAAKLLDIETASNNGGWQWSASTGVDPKPLRIFNPTLQAERYDPTGAYIRRFVPELSKVPDKYIHAPHAMPPEVQRESGCIIGKDYPAPIVDHRGASERFKAEYARVKGRGTV